MLKKIIKRNKFTENFDPSKLNKWSRWASEDISDRVDWSGVVLDTIKECPEEISSKDLQKKLIDVCLSRDSWPYQIMAGRLYGSLLRKDIYGDHIPTLKKIHKKLIHLGLMVDLGYSEEEYEAIEEIIDHTRDFNLAFFQIRYMSHKYSLQNRKTGEAYETPQVIYMRMAMAVHANKSADIRIKYVKEFYDHLSFNRINAPTPNYVNLGTPHHGLASCCLYAAGDSARSLAIGDFIAYTQTYMSAGIGSNIMCRSVGDNVRSGAISHQGKLPYYRSLAGAIRANMQGSRGGACTVYYSCFDPEAETITMLQNPKTTVDVQNRILHFGVLTNKFFAQKVIENKECFQFNIKTAPDLHKAFYSGDTDLFKSLYEKYENDSNFKKTYFNARKLALKFIGQFYDVSTVYHLSIDEVNRHTSYLDPIYSSNLCAEIVQPTAPYESMEDLFKQEDHQRGEVSQCTIGGIVVCNIDDEETYASAMYHCLEMIDQCIEIGDYELPHVEYTTKRRRNAAVGIVGLATLMAKNNQKFDTREGLDFVHKVAERHAWHAINQALKLGMEKGNAPWIHKTKWPQGWLPIDTYNKGVDELVEPSYQYDWESLRKEIIDNGGIRFSSLIAHMPSESSSKASGVPNGLYPIRDLALKKTDGTNAVEWCAKNGDLMDQTYQRAWTISEVDLVKFYAIIQKFTDQSISADLFRDRTVNISIKTKEMLDLYLTMVKYGLKSKYYTNSLTSDDDRDAATQSVGCESGVCTL
jgi:ribonucleoside-diphosphate reductase alpha chain